MIGPECGGGGFVTEPDAASFLRLHPFKHFITDELRGNGFSNTSLTPSLGRVALSGPTSRLEADGRSDREEKRWTTPK